MRTIWARAIVAVTTGIGVLLAGLTLTGSLDATPDPVTGLVGGADTFTFLAAVAILAAFVAYAAVEYLQTGRVESVARQFDTRTIVLIPFAIALNVTLGQTVGEALRLPLYLDSLGTILVGVLAGPLAGALTGLLSDFTWTFVLAATPLGSPTAWPFAITAAEIGLVAGIAGRLGVFRSRPHTRPGRLAAGLGASTVILVGLVVLGIVPFYAAPGKALLIDPADAAPFFLVTARAVLVVLAIALVGLVAIVVARRDLGPAYVVVAGVICGTISALISTPIATYFFGGVTGSGADLLVAIFQKAGSSLEQAVAQQSLLQDPIDKTVEFLVVYALVQALSRRVVARFPQGERVVAPAEG